MFFAEKVAIGRVLFFAVIVHGLPIGDEALLYATTDVELHLAVLVIAK